MALPEQYASPAPSSIGLPSYVLQGLRSVFDEHAAIESVTLYGSRAKGNFRNNSDIDLMLTGPNLSWSEFNAVEREIDDLLLPWKVDLGLKHQVDNSELIAHVERVGIVIYHRKRG